MVVTGCQENKSCSKVLNFLERLDDRIRCTHKETVAVVKPRKDIGSNKSLLCMYVCGNVLICACVWMRARVRDRVPHASLDVMSS